MRDRSDRPLATAPPRTASVVIATFGRPESLRRSLAAVFAQTRPAEQVIVASRRDDLVTAQALPGLRSEFPFELVACDEPRLVAQMDAGVRAATGDLVAFTDDDAAPRPQWLAGLMSLYDDARVGVAGGRDVIHEPGVDSTANGRAVGVISWRGQPLDNHHRAGVGARPVDVLKGVNMSIRRDLWSIDTELLGDEGNQPHWELGVCLRARRLGWLVIYDPKLLVDHYAESRVQEPQRHTRDDFSFVRDAHNELFELVRWLPWWQWPIATLNAFLVGSRAVPGVVAGLWLATHGLGVPAAHAEVLAASRGRARALRARPRAGRRGRAR